MCVCKYDKHETENGHVKPNNLDNNTFEFPKRKEWNQGLDSQGVSIS